MKKSYLTLFNCFLIIVIFTNTSTAQVFRAIDNEDIVVDWDVCTYYPSGEISTLKILRSNFSDNRLPPCSNFIVDYDAGFDANPTAKAAFQFAVDIWAEQLDSSIDIRVDANFGPLDPGVLGGAGPNGLVGLNVGGVISFYARPLAEALLGSETADGGVTPSNDITATFSSVANFYFGTDGNVPAGQIDFVTVVLHELGHGLGILGLGSVPTVNGVPSPNPPVVGQINPGGFPSIWDRFIENGSGTSILTFADPSATLLTEFQSGDLFSNGTIATSQNSNIAPETYAPSTFSPGSSYSHWDETVFNGTANALMTPFVANQEVIHDPGNVTLGFMEDMGWTLCQGTLSAEDFGINDVKISPNPFLDTIIVDVPFSIANQEFNVSIVDINGRIISSLEANTINGEITISNLSNLKSALYFLNIESKTSDLSITKKIIKQ